MHEPHVYCGTAAWRYRIPIVYRLTLPLCIMLSAVDVWVAQNLDLRGDKIPADLAHKFIGLPLGLNFHTLRQQINGDFKDAGAMRGKGSTTKEQSDALAGIATASAPFGQRQPMVFLPLMTEFKKRHDNDRGLCKRHFWGGAGHNISVRQDGGLTSRTEHWKYVEFAFEIDRAACGTCLVRREAVRLHGCGGCCGSIGMQQC